MIIVEGKEVIIEDGSIEGLIVGTTVGNVEGGFVG